MEIDIYKRYFVCASVKNKKGLSGKDQTNQHF